MRGGPRRPPCRALARAAAVCAVLLGSAGVAAGQFGSTVVEVRLEQEGRTIADPGLVGLVATRVGAPLAMRDVRETIAHLDSLSRFEDIQPIAEATPGGVRVRYVLVPLHPVTLVDFRGDLGLSRDELRRLVQDRFGRAPAAARAAEVTDAVRQHYVRRGYVAARVATRIEEHHDPDRATMVVEVGAGARATIAGVRIDQVDRDELGPPPTVPEVQTGAPYDQDEVEADLERWVERMHDLGNYEARASHVPTFAGGTATVTLSIASGPRVVVSFAGDPLPAGERERLVPVRAEGSADQDLLEDASRAIEGYFFALGYRDARAPFTPVRTGGELRITFDVDRGPRYLVRRIAVTAGGSTVPAEIRELLTVEEGQPFVEATLGTGVAAIRNAYQARGFVQAAVRPSVTVAAPERAADPDRAVDVSVEIAEGPRTLVGAVTFQGNLLLADASLASLMTTVPGRVYSQGATLADRDRIDLEYRNRGFDSVVVSVEPTVVADGTRADVAVTVTEGPQILVDDIIVVGNVRTRADTITRELLLRPGEPLGYTALIDSRTQIMSLGLFSSVQIDVAGQSGQARRDLIVRVEESDPSILDVGGGVEGGFIVRTGADGQAEERFELAPRGFIQIGRRNLWGKNREATLFTRVSLRSRDRVVGTPTAAMPVDTSYGFHEYRVVGTFREPRVFGSQSNVLLTALSEQAIRTSFNFSRRVVRAETDLRRSSGHSLVGRYSFEHTKLFDEANIPLADKPLIDRLFPEVRLSKFAGAFVRDTRDDLLETTRGWLLLAGGDLAARAIGSEVGFVKATVEASTYHRIRSVRQMVLALRARMGAAHGFPREVGGQVVQDLPASERFFAGGETSVRGFLLDRLGNRDTIGASGFPTGGNGVIVVNAELRVPVYGPFHGVGFVDAGNVFARAGGLDVTDLRPAAGIGMRYVSRYIPLRVDLGFNLDRRELGPGTRERGYVFHISMGPAF